MIFSIFYPFSIVVLYAVSEFIKEEKNKVKPLASHKIYDLANSSLDIILDYGLPIFSGTFIFVFWTFGIINYFWPNVKTLCTV